MNGIAYQFTKEEIEAIIQLIEWARERNDSALIIEIVATALNRNAFQKAGIHLQ